MRRRPKSEDWRVQAVCHLRGGYIATGANQCGCERCGSFLVLDSHTQVQGRGGIWAMKEERRLAAKT